MPIKLRGAAASRAASRTVNALIVMRGWRGRLFLIAPECIAVLAILALVWGGIWTSLETQRDNAELAAIRDTGNLARAFEENTDGIFANADRILLALRAEYEQTKGHFDLVAWVKVHIPRDRMVAQIAVIDREGMSVASTASTQRVSVADRPHFIAQKTAAADTLEVSRPVLGRSSNRWTIQVTRKIVDAAGAFDGVVVLSVDCYDLSHFYETLDLQQGFIALLGTDGVLRARGPVAGDAIGADLSGTIAFRAAQQAPHGTAHVPDEPGRAASTISFRRLQAYPLMVMVGFDDAKVFARYDEVRLEMLGCGIGGSLAVILLGAMWVVQRTRALESRKALALTLDTMSQGIVMLDAQSRVAVINHRAVELLDLPPWRESPDLDRAMERALASYCDMPGSFTQIVTAADGRVTEGHRQCLPDGRVLLTVTDVTARRAAEERIRHLALYDHLTGLGNRALLAETVDAGLHEWALTGMPFALLCIDLDGFKKVNDTLGHDVGDLLLVSVAERLRATVHTCGFVARTGGDEFIVLVRGADLPAAAERLARRIVAALGEPVAVGTHQLRVGAGIGIANCPAHGTGRAELMKHGDLALYRAKTDKADPVRVFHPAMAAELGDRLELEQDLREAIGTRALHVVYQPQFTTTGLQVVGFQALVRWRHPVRGAMRPDQFIPLAEETGLIVALGRQVLERACAAAAAWPTHLRIAVNISPAQFRDVGLPEMVAEVLARSGLSPRRLELEITEGVLVADEAQALRTLHALRALGIRVALDDFGTGFSSLSYLRKFPFDSVKLDRSFVQAQVSEPKARAILEAVLMLSRRLRLGVVAEGVETEEQLELLRGQQCPEVQGYLMSRPLATEGVEAFMAAHVANMPAPSATGFALAPAHRGRMSTPRLHALAG